MPQACTRMRTCPEPGLGISRSTISKSAPGFGICTTFIFAIGALQFQFWIHVQDLDARFKKSDTFFSVTEPAERLNTLRGESQKVLQRFPKRCTGPGLTRARVPRTMPHRLELDGARILKNNSALALRRSLCYKNS